MRQRKISNTLAQHTVEVCITKYNAVIYDQPSSPWNVAAPRKAHNASHSTEKRRRRWNSFSVRLSLDATLFAKNLLSLVTPLFRIVIMLEKIARTPKIIRKMVNILDGSVVGCGVP